MPESQTVTILGIDADRLPLEGWRLDALFSLLGAWLIIGVTWDFGAHASGISFEEEGFLTVPHVTFYSAAGAIGLLILAATVTNVARIRANREEPSLWRAVPVGYRIGVLGVILFGIGGPLDFLWHSTFGAEAGLEALTSPTHLLLATGAVLFLSSPLRASWVRGVGDRLRSQLPMLSSAAFVVISIAAFGMYANPLFQPIADPGPPFGEGLVGGMTAENGVLAVVAFSALVTGMCLVLLSRFDVATGGFTYILTVVSLPFSAATAFAFLPAMMLGGLSADVLNRSLSPGRANPLSFRVFGAVVPLVLFGTYFAIHEAVWGLAWSAHIWTGAITVGVLVGILMSYAVVPFGGTPRADSVAADGSGDR